MNSELHTTAMAMLDRGMAVVPIHRAGYAYTQAGGSKVTANGKGPIVPNWQAEQLSRQRLSSVLTASNGDIAGIGVVTGAMSNNLVILDFDLAAWAAAFEDFLHCWPELAHAPIVQTGSGKRHIWFRCPDLPPDFIRKEYSRPDLDAKIDLRGNKCQCLVPPSIHPSGGRYEWLTDSAELVDIPFDEMRQWLEGWAGDSSASASTPTGKST